MKKRSLPEDEAPEVRTFVRTERKAGLGDFDPKAETLKMVKQVRETSRWCDSVTRLVLSLSASAAPRSVPRLQRSW